jgi:carbon dioxide concentrating mechanism protein CcmN
MSLQPIHLPNYPHVRILGDVCIDPSAAIAPGTILQAAPGCQIQIGAGVCLGMGVILNANTGAIRLEEGVSLGPGVLVVGHGVIGANACVGGLTTLYQADIEAMSAIAAGSLLGDPTRQVDLAALPEPAPQSVADDPWLNETPAAPTEPEPQPPKAAPPDPVPPPGTPPYGKVMVNQLLVTLFPYGSPQNRSRPTP